MMNLVIIQSFLDSEVLEPDFRQTLADVALVMMPFVHWCVFQANSNVHETQVRCSLNDMMTVLEDEEES